MPIFKLRSKLMRTPDGRDLGSNVGQFFEVVFELLMRIHFHTIFEESVDSVRMVGMKVGQYDCLCGLTSLL